MFTLATAKYWIGLGIAGVIALVAWDYANTKSNLAAVNGENTRLRASIAAIETTNKLNLEAIRNLDKSCKAQIDRLMNLHDIEKILKDAADPIGTALDFDPNKKR